jgi:hypothetical protein
MQNSEIISRHPELPASKGGQSPDYQSMIFTLATGMLSGQVKPEQASRNINRLMLADRHLNPLNQPDYMSVKTAIDGLDEDTRKVFLSRLPSSLLIDLGDYIDIDFCSSARMASYIKDVAYKFSKIRGQQLRSGINDAVGSVLKPVEGNEVLRGQALQSEAEIMLSNFGQIIEGLENRIDEDDFVIEVAENLRSEMQKSNKMPFYVLEMLFLNREFESVNTMIIHGVDSGLITDEDLQELKWIYRNSAAFDFDDFDRDADSGDEEEGQDAEW